MAKFCKSQLLLNLVVDLQVFYNSVLVFLFVFKKISLISYQFGIKLADMVNKS